MHFSTRRLDLKRFPEKADQPAMLYILACSNDSFYTGVTQNLAVRFTQHERGWGAADTRYYGVALMVAFWRFTTRREALEWEQFFIPRLAKRKPSTYPLRDLLTLYNTHAELLRGHGRQVTGVLLSEV